MARNKRIRNKRYMERMQDKKRDARKRKSQNTKTLIVRHRLKVAWLIMIDEEKELKQKINRLI